MSTKKRVSTKERPAEQCKILASTHKLIKSFAAENGMFFYDALDLLVKRGMLVKPQR